MTAIERRSRGSCVAPLQHTETEQFVAHLRTLIGPERWRVWFDGATDFHLADGGLRVGVANLFISDYVRTHFGERLRAAARQAFGRDLPLQFHVQSDLFQKRREQNLVDEADAMDQLGQTSQRPAPSITPARTPIAPAQPAADLPRIIPPRRSSQPPRPTPAEHQPLFTLQNFVTGPCNDMAYAAAKSAAATPGKDFHPLFIHGACGLGKTHLLQAILHALRGRGDLRVACLSAEQFTNRYLAGMRSGSLDAFRHRYRNLDVLAIDDVHFLAGKVATQEEFLHTYNEFDGRRRLVILASDSHPREIQAVQDHLISRWVSGLVVRLSAPDEETRRRILMAKARFMGRPVPEEVIALVAARIQGSVRELEGALTRIMAFAALLKQPMTTDLARQALADFVAAAPRRTTMPEIEETVAAFFGVTRTDVHSARKSHQVSLARQITMVLAREMTDLSFSDIARSLGGKNHTTVLAACRKLQMLVKSGGEIRWADRSDNRSMSAEALLAHLKERIRG